MARIVQLLEVDLNGATFRIQVGGSVALVDKDTPVAVVQVNTLEEAERLETFASLFAFTFRWKEQHDRSNPISLDELQKLLAADPVRFFQAGARERVATLGISFPQHACPGCGTTEGTFFGDYCGGCAFVDNNPHGHDD